LSHSFLSAAARSHAKGSHSGRIVPGGEHEHACLLKREAPTKLFSVPFDITVSLEGRTSACAPALLIYCFPRCVMVATMAWGKSVLYR
jgi:hypothetical protein